MNSEVIDNYSFFRGGAFYLLSLKNCQINSSVFKNNSVYFDENLSIEDKNSKYFLS